MTYAPRRSSRLSLLAASIALAGVLSGCDGSDFVSPDPLSGGGDMQMLVVSGSDQIGVAGLPLAGPLVVKVVDNSGVAKGNQIVNFVVVEGGGTVFAGTGLTDATGKAQEIWTLGPTTGAQSVEARAVDTQTGERRIFAVFKATAGLVAPAPVGSASVQLSVASLGLASLGESKTMGVTAKDKDGIALAASSLSWSSTATGVATVNGSGSVTAASNGQTRIIAAYGTAADTATVTVSQVVTSLTVTPASASVNVGGSLGLTAQARDALGGVVQGASMTWTSSNAGVATVDGTGRVAAVAAGSATIGATTSGRSASSSIQVTAVAVVGGAWPNQPAGFVTITDQPWNALSSNGWGHMNRASQSRIVADATAPHSPSGVLEHLYPAGYTSMGREPAVDWKNLGGASEIFVGFWWKPSNPWQGHSTGINKVLFAMNENNSKNVVLVMRGAPGGPYYLDAFPEGHPAATGGYLTQNKTRIPVRLGQWHRVEMRVKIAGGIIQWWVDGTLVGDYSGLNLATGGFGELQIAPTWGGLGGPNKLQTDYFRYDHLIASKPAG